MKTLAKVGAALLGTMFGMMAIAIVSPKAPGHPGVIVGFGGTGALVGLLLIPRIARWIRDAFVGDTDDTSDPPGPTTAR